MTAGAPDWRSTPEDPVAANRQWLNAGGSYASLGVRRSRSILHEIRPRGGRSVKSITDSTLPLTPPMPIRTYRPRTAAPASTVVWIHGGGWCLGDLDTADRTCRALAAQSGQTVVSLDYRLAPEYRFPVPLDDVVRALCWISENPQDFGGPTGPVVIAGESAGANLAVGACLTLQGRYPFAHLLLVVPVVDLAVDRPSMRADRDPTMAVSDLLWFADQYLPDPAAADDPRMAPLKAGSLSWLPPTTVITAELDPLRDGAVELIQAMRRDLVAVGHRDYLDSGHGFFASIGNLVGQCAVDHAAEVLRHVAHAGAAGTGAVSGLQDPIPPETAQPAESTPRPSRGR